MKILLVSDSHGYDDELKKVLENVKCDLKIHCGDSCFDKNSPFIKEFAAIVDGNHDQGFFPLTTTLPTAFYHCFHNRYQQLLDLYVVSYVIHNNIFVMHLDDQLSQKHHILRVILYPYNPYNTPVT